MSEVRCRVEVHTCCSSGGRHIHKLCPAVTKWPRPTCKTSGPSRGGRQQRTHGVPHPMTERGGRNATGAHQYEPGGQQISCHDCEALPAGLADCWTLCVFVLSSLPTNDLLWAGNVRLIPLLAETPPALVPASSTRASVRAWAIAFTASCTRVACPSLRGISGSHLSCGPARRCKLSPQGPPPRSWVSHHLLFLRACPRRMPLLTILVSPMRTKRCCFFERSVIVSLCFQPAQLV